jgi:hypothetical protein
MKRSGFLTRSNGSARLEVKLRPCKSCRRPFAKVNGWQKYCRQEACAVAAAEEATAKREKQEAREHKKKLDDSKPLQHWLKLTERVVNHYILVRDRALTCISCGTGQTVQWEAGHYHSVGSHPELRYDPININKQCHRCNFDMGGNLAMYVIGLEAKWGRAERERLDGHHPSAHYTREDLAAIRKEFAALTRELEKLNGR